MKRTSIVSNVSLVVCLVLAMASSALAQVATTGQIVGSVQDPSGAAVPGATLRLENENTREVQSTTTGADGGFVFPNVMPGSYDLTVDMQGFQTAVYTAIVVNAARTTNQAVTLKVGAVSETVEVTGAGPVLQTTSTTVSGTVDQNYLQDLPLPGRDTLPFTLLMAGAQQGVTAPDSTFNGMPGAAINITLNGIANNAQRFKSGGTSFFAFVTPRLETVQEVTGFDIEPGRRQYGPGRDADPIRHQVGEQRLSRRGVLAAPEFRVERQRLVQQRPEHPEVRLHSKRSRRVSRRAHSQEPALFLRELCACDHTAVAGLRGAGINPGLRRRATSAIWEATALATPSTCFKFPAKMDSRAPRIRLSEPSYRRSSRLRKRAASLHLICFEIV